MVPAIHREKNIGIAGDPDSKNQSFLARPRLDGNSSGCVQLIFRWNYGLIALPYKQAGVAKLADAPDLGSGGAILRGSSPLSGKLLQISHLRYKPRQLSTFSLNECKRVSVGFEPVSFS